MKRFIFCPESAEVPSVFVVDVSPLGTVNEYLYSLLFAASTV